MVATGQRELSSPGMEEILQGLRLKRGFSFLARKSGPGLRTRALAGARVLRPSPDFLAKNEDPFLRRQPWRISPIPGVDNSLYPVATTQGYLQRTADLQSGSLFRHHLSGKPLTICGTRCCLTSIIKKHNPESIPKTHDLHKMASLLAFFEGMTFPDIASMTGWSFPRDFM